jgi:hypothetical protein
MSNCCNDCHSRSFASTSCAGASSNLDEKKSVFCSSVFCRAVVCSSSPRCRDNITSKFQGAIKAGVGREIPIVSRTELPNKLPVHSSSFLMSAPLHSLPFTSTISSPSARIPCRCAALRFESLTILQVPGSTLMFTTVLSAGAVSKCGFTSAAQRQSGSRTFLKLNSRQQVALRAPVRWRTARPLPHAGQEQCLSSLTQRERKEVRAEQQTWRPGSASTTEAETRSACREGRAQNSPRFPGYLMVAAMRSAAGQRTVCCLPAWRPLGTQLHSFQWGLGADGFGFRTIKIE